MRINNPQLLTTSNIVANADLDMGSTFQIKNLAAPASGEVLRKSRADIEDGDISDVAGITATKVSLTGYIENVHVNAAAAIALSKTALDLTTHKIRHQSGGADEVDASGLKGLVSFTASPSATLYASADTERTSSDDGYVKYKEIKISVPGTYTIKFDLKAATNTYTAYGRVYKNEAAVGAEETNDTDSYDTKSADIAGWMAGDLCQLYIHRSSPFNALAENFRVYADFSPSVEVILD